LTVQPVAIIGLGARLPGAWDAAQFWDNLIEGRESVTFSSRDELLRAGVPAPVADHPSFVPAEMQIPGFDEIDAGLFGLTPREARLADPQFRLFLEVCHAALENAGYDPFDVPGPAAVFGSTGTPTYLFEHVNVNRDPLNQAQVALLNNADYLATQVAYRLNLSGPAMTVMTACSSSLTATQLAVQSLLTGDCRVALAGGVATEIDARFGYFYSPGGVRARDGHCRPFDAAGAGTVFSSGAGAVLLKRLDDALADGDHVYAVLRGISVNNDGAAKTGYGAPSIPGQVACIRAAMRAADATPDQLSYVEAHATGTQMGDGVEVRALLEAWRSLSDAPVPAGACGIGSVKSNVGHTAQAAGIVGLIKVALAMDRGQLPPTLNVTAPIDELADTAGPLRLVTEPEDWSRRPDRPRLAALSSFGVGGTNVHAVLAEPPAAAPTPATERPRVVLWSAQSAAAADAGRARLADHFAATTAYDDSVTTLQRGRTPFAVRRAFVADRAATAAAALRGEPGSPAVLEGRAGSTPPLLAWAFPGQGSLFVRMGVELADADARFAGRLDAAFELFGETGRELREHWRSDDDPARLARTGTAQPLLFAVELALADTLLDWGIRPDAVTGHSVGELVAGTVAGVLDRGDAARLVLARAEAMDAMEPGAMAAVFADPDTVAAHLADGVGIAAVNSAREVVVSGPREAIGAFLAGARQAGLRATILRTSHAFHSAGMRPAAERFRAAFEGVTLHRPTIPLISAAAGTGVDEAATDPRFWADQLVDPVRFDRATDALVELARTTAAAGLLVAEVGPGDALSGLVAGHESARTGGTAVLATLPRPRPGAATPDAAALQRAAAGLWVHGVPVDWTAVDGAAPAHRVPMPGYAYQRERYWVDAPLWTVGAPAEVTRTVAEPAAVPAADQPDPVEAAPPRTAGPFSVLTWTEQPVPAAEEPAQPAERHVAVVFLPADRDTARRAVIALQQAGRRLITVRAGERFEERDNAFTVEAGRPGQVDRVLTALRDRGVTPAELVHATTMDGWDPVSESTVDGQLESAFFGLLELIQALGRGLTTATRLTVLTSRSVDVSGSDRLDPVKATLHGLVRTAAAESPRTPIRLIDVDERTAEEDLVDELRLTSAELVVGLRGARRWVRGETPYGPRDLTAPPLRRKGVYLITGGLGGLGLELVRGLARTGLQPAIVLMGRHAPDDDPSSPAAVALAEATALGARIKVVTGDVGNRRDLVRVLDVSAAMFGPVNGVFQLAGVAGDGVLMLRGRAEAEAVLRPKVRGTVMLSEALAGQGAPVDFWVSFASRAGVNGLAGSGDYAAANAFLDAWATATNGPDTRVLSIDWPSWSGVGMAAEELARLAAGDSTAADVVWESTLSPETTWALAEHRLADQPVLPGAAVVDMIVRAYRDRFGTDQTTVVLRDVVFRAALAVTGNAAVRVAFRLRDDGHDVTVESRTGAGEWRTHASGRIGTEQPARPARVVDVAGLEVAFKGGTEEAEAATTPGRSFTLGPRWHNVVTTRSVGGERLVELALPDRFAADLAAHPLHPALLDSATASVRLVTEPPAVPFAYQTMRLHHPLPARFLSHVRRTADTPTTIVADIDLVAPDGTLLAEIQGFAMRHFEAGTFLAAPSGGGRRNDGAGPGIPPEEGVELALRLLASRTPPQALVRPYVDGVPVPLAAAVTAVPEQVRQVAPEPAVPPVPVEPRSAGDGGATIERLRTIWVETLGMTDLEPTDDFFDVGGTSLSAIELIARIRDEFRIDITITSLLEAPTLGAAADLVDSLRS
jgi:acyl transferase domain-containing protein/acyl carrier protein